MSTILEDIGQRHSARTKSMHKYRLELPLNEVEDHDSHGELLEIGGRRNLGRAQGRERVDVGSQKIDSRVYKDRAEIFDNEDGAPCDLWSEVFHGDGCAGGESGALECS